MSTLEQLQPNAAIRGILPDSLVTVVNVQWFGSEALELTYKAPDGKVANELLYRHDEPRIEGTLRDLALSIGIDLQPGLGEVAGGPATRTQLQALASSLNNQLQLTNPAAYSAQGLEGALDSLFRRYVSRRVPKSKVEKSLTHAVLRDRVWHVVKEWNQASLRVTSGGLIRGLKAAHHVDISILNGHPRAAMIALSTHPDDRNLAYLYRDSLPTTAGDMEPQFRLFAVLPTLGPQTTSEEKRFVQETEQFLEGTQGVKTVHLDALPEIKQEVVSYLL